MYVIVNEQSTGGLFVFVLKIRMRNEYASSRAQRLGHPQIGGKKRPRIAARRERQRGHEYTNRPRIPARREDQRGWEVQRGHECTKSFSTTNNTDFHEYSGWVTG
jgi:hypothetical protein